MSQSRRSQPSQPRRSVQFDDARPPSDMDDYERRQQHLPQIPSGRQVRPSSRRKLQKAPRQRHIRTSPPHAIRTVPLNRSASTLSGDSRGHLLPSDAHNRTLLNGRYPPRASQRSVLRKRRNDAAVQRLYNTFPARRPEGGGDQHPFPVQEPLPRVPEQERQEPDPVSEHGVVSPPEPSVAAPGILLSSTQPSAPLEQSTSWAGRRWSSLEPSSSTNAVITNTSPEDQGAINANRVHHQKALPALPPHARTQSTPAHYNASRRHSELPPLPLYTAPPPASPTIPQAVADIAYQKRLVSDFVQGERQYLDTLRQCVKNEDIFVGSIDLLLSLLSLIQVGEDLIIKIDLDPSPLGVASAFLAVCRNLEAALLKWSEDLSQVSLDGSTVLADHNKHKALPPTPQMEYDQDDGAPRRRSSLLKRVSGLWSSKSRRSASSSGGGMALSNSASSVKPDRVWQRSGMETSPGLWEMSVLPAQRMAQYRYLFRGKFYVHDSESG